MATYPPPARDVVDVGLDRHVAIGGDSGVAASSLFRIPAPAETIRLSNLGADPLGAVLRSSSDRHGDLLFFVDPGKTAWINPDEHRTRGEYHELLLHVADIGRGSAALRSPFSPAIHASIFAVRSSR
jgi:hypothetical protein